MFLLDAAEAARRTRAALAYADIDVKDSDERVGIGYSTMTRIVSPKNPRGFKSIEEAWKIADACGVPREFMEHGFGNGNPASEPDQALKDAVAEIRAQVLSLRRDFEERPERDRRTGSGEGGR